MLLRPQRVLARRVTYDQHREKNSRSRDCCRADRRIGLLLDRWRRAGRPGSLRDGGASGGAGRSNGDVRERFRLDHPWLVEPGNSGQGVVLLLHGVRGSRLDMLSRAEFLHRLGYSVLLMDFQAHGESPGSKITFGHLESLDVEAALRFLNDRYPGEKIGVIGTSMGAAAMVLTVHRAKVQAVVLESMYPTIDQATEDRLRLYLGRMGIVFAPLLTGQLRLRLGIDPAALRPIARMRDLQAPVFITSGTLDRHTTIEEAKSIYAAAGEPKQFWAVEGAEHVDLHRFAPVEYETRVANFLGTYLRPSVP